MNVNDSSRLWLPLPDAHVLVSSGASGSAGSDSTQVEDCGRDLGGLTTYHQRCRICEVHIKLPSFVRHGTMQRFCQQCGRCHQLAAFDSGKRSCRAQLVKHNARCVLFSVTAPCIPTAMPCPRPCSACSGSHCHCPPACMLLQSCTCVTLPGIALRPTCGIEVSHCMLNLSLQHPQAAQAGKQEGGTGVQRRRQPQDRASRRPHLARHRRRRQLAACQAPRAPPHRQGRRHDGVDGDAVRRRRRQRPPTGGAGAAETGAPSRWPGAEPDGLSAQLCACVRARPRGRGLQAGGWRRRRPLCAGEIRNAI